MIKLENDFYIDADDRCFMLKKKTVNEKNKETVITIGYYNSLKNALNSYVKCFTMEKIKDGKIRSIHTLLTSLETFLEDLEKKMKI